jgi:hypothetical protein
MAVAGRQPVSGTAAVAALSGPAWRMSAMAFRLAARASHQGHISHFSISAH